MSILLDALRKSEQRKHLGEVPDIHRAAAEPGKPQREGLGRLVWLLLAAAFAALLWLAWRQYAPPQPTVDAATAEPAEAAPTSDQQPLTSDQQSPADGQPAAAVAGPRTPVESLAQIEPRPEPPGAGQDVDSGGKQAAAKSKARSKPSVQAQSKAQDQNAQPEEDRAKPRQPPPISYWELPESIRNELPEFRISVLVYAEQPEDRFLLLNGRRANQSDEVVTGLKLLEIQRDRAIFDYRKYRFYVKQ